jgi:CHAT domain-containing protein
MAPIQKLLGKTRHIYLSPDGALNLVPFDALVDENGHYLVESLAITYLPSGRDLVRMGNSAPSRQAATIFAGPDYETGKNPETRPRHQFSPLRYAKEEARSVAASMRGTSTLEGATATEAAIKALHAPKILHISTHGFFDEDLPALHEAARHAFQMQLRPPAPVENALLRSGLAFAGANRSGVGNEDGVLTALEASQLDLWGTKLVVLSACETGKGQAENGDGVYGLRRAFGIAGAETVVMSLWQVDGRATGDLMKSYYQGLSKGDGRAESLRQAQLAMLASPERAHPHYWASFIVSGDDRSMEGHAIDTSLGRVKPGAGGCGACEIGVAQETATFCWLSVLMTGAMMGARRRKAQMRDTTKVPLTPGSSEIS